VPTLSFKEIPATWAPNKDSLLTIINNLGTDDPEEWFGQKINVLGEIKYKGGQEQCWKSVVPKKDAKTVVAETYAKQTVKQKGEKPVGLDDDDIPFL
jgi:hypothetical protein